MYVNYYDKKVKIGERKFNDWYCFVHRIEKNAVAEMALPEIHTQMFISKYQTAPSSREELKQLLEKQNNKSD